MPIRLVLGADGQSAGDLRAGLKAGAQAVMAAYDPELIAALDELRREFDFAVYPIVPNAPQYVRDLADLGMAGAALKRLRRMPAGAWLRLMGYGVANVRRVLAKDFAAMLGVMVQMELPAFARYRPPAVFLHAHLTDLLLACGNAEALRSFADLMRRHGTEPGLETRNFGHLMPKLDEWDLDVTFVAAPFNPQGSSMRPAPETCLQIARQTQKTVLARAESSRSLEEALDYLRGCSISSAVVSPALAAGVARTPGHD